MKTITVAELKDLLDGLDDDALVITSSDYGDHSHTEQALPLRGEVELVTITQSAYSNSGWAIGEPEIEDDDMTSYVVIR